jgi:hypothetical protein
MFAHPPRSAVLVALLVAVLALAACSRKAAIGDESDAAAASTVSSTTSSSTTSTVPTDSSLPVEDPGAPSTTTTTSPDGFGAFGYTDAELASFRAAYAQAFEAECRRIWSSYSGGTGLLADPDFPEDTYTVDDCLTELDDSNGEFADSVDEARSTGVDDAQIAASDLADPLCATGGAPCWSYGD